MIPEDGAVRNAGDVVPTAVIEPFRMGDVAYIKRRDVAFRTADEGDDVAVDGRLTTHEALVQRDGDRLLVGGDSLRGEDVEILVVGGDEFAVEGGEGVVVVIDAERIRRCDKDLGDGAVQIEPALAVAEIAGDDSVDVTIRQIVVVEDADPVEVEDVFRGCEIRNVEKTQFATASMPCDDAAIHIDMEDLREVRFGRMRITRDFAERIVRQDVVDADAVWAFCGVEAVAMDGDVVCASHRLCADDGDVIRRNFTDFDARMGAGEEGDIVFVIGGETDLHMARNVDCLESRNDRIWHNFRRDKRLRL